MNTKLVLILTAGLLACWLPVAGAANLPDNLAVVVSKVHVTNNGSSGGSLGAFGYSVADGKIYTAVFGSGRNIRCFDPKAFNKTGFGVVSNAEGTSWGYAYATDIELVTRSPNIPSGVTNADWGGAFNTSSMIINPAPVVYNGVIYGAGQLAIMTTTNNNVTVGTTTKYEYSKRLMTYDLREIWAKTTRQPDYNNAQNGVGAIYGAFGKVDWNDCFTAIITKQDMATLVSQAPNLSDNMGRQACWSTDGQRVYFVDAGQYYGGIWRVKMNLAPGQADRIVRLIPDMDNTTGNQRNYAEPVAIHTATRDFTGGQKSGQQILFMGTSTYGNVGGVNCVVDDDTIVPSNPATIKVYPVVDGHRLCDFAEVAYVPSNLPSAFSIVSDPNGIVYFYMTDIYSVYQLDKRNRLYAVKNRPQNIAFNTYLGSTSPTGNSNLRLQYRDATNPIDPNLPMVGQLLFQSQEKCVGGIYVFKPVDFNRDNTVNLTDMAYFKTQYARNASFADPNNLPALANMGAYLDYFKADINGNGKYNSITKKLDGICVTEKDIEALYQFVYPGDSDIDYDVDANDYAALKAKFNPFGNGNWAEGDYDFDGDIDLRDFIRLKDNQKPAYLGGPVVWKGEYDPAKYQGEPILRRAGQGELALIVNIDTGELKLMAEGLALEGYQILSTAGLLKADTWQPLQGRSGMSGWEKLGGATRYLAEGNLTGNTVVDGIIPLGKAFAGDFRDLKLTYNGENKGVIVGSADINNDGLVNVQDFSAFASDWLGAGCIHPDWCQRSDLNFDGKVDNSDLLLFMNQWLD